MDWNWKMDFVCARNEISKNFQVCGVAYCTYSTTSKCNASLQTCPMADCEADSQSATLQVVLQFLFAVSSPYSIRISQARNQLGIFWILSVFQKLKANWTCTAPCKSFYWWCCTPLCPKGFADLHRLSFVKQYWSKPLATTC